MYVYRKYMMENKNVLHYSVHDGCLSRTEALSTVCCLFKGFTSKLWST